MDRRLLGIAAVVLAIVVIVAIVLFVLPPPAPALVITKSIAEGYFELGQSWRDEGVDLDTIDLSDYTAIKAISAVQFQAIKSNLASFKAKLTDNYIGEEALATLADVFTAKVDLVEKQKDFLLASEQASFSVTETADIACAKFKAGEEELFNALDAYLAVYNDFIEKSNAFVLGFYDQSVSVGFLYKGEEHDAVLDSLLDLRASYLTTSAECEAIE